MKDEDVQQILNELADVRTRLENTEGYFGNFDITLNNHMKNYDGKLNSLSRRFAWGFWVIFSLTTVALAGLLTITALLVQRFLGG